MGPPFRTLASSSLLYLSWKVAFLVAFTSARRVSEIRVLTSEPSYMVSFKYEVQLCPHPVFFPKVVSQFHSNQAIFLPVFYPKSHANRKEQKLHSLDVRRALAFYIERSKPLQKSTHLFIEVADRMKVFPCLLSRFPCGLHLLSTCVTK